MKVFFKNHKWFRRLGKFFIGLAAFAAIVFVFLQVWPPFGGSVSAEDEEEYEKRFKNYDGKFENEGEFSVLKSGDGEDRSISEKDKRPEDEIPEKTPDFSVKSDFQFTWLGHSSFIMQINGLNILIDPVFSEYASPVQFVGAKRFSKVPVEIDELPKIDIVIITHDHYDHLDYNTIKDIDSLTGKFIVPLGVENHLERWGVSEEKITTMSWWEEIEINGLTIGCTPGQHYSTRSIGDQYETLWASWVFKNDSEKIYLSGDTGFGEHFQEIYDKYGDFDIAFLDAAQYDNRWTQVHMNPEEAYNAAEILHAKVAMPIHWATYSLANHPWDDPAERFLKASENGDIKVITPYIGETVYSDNYDNYKVNWWKEVK